MSRLDYMWEILTQRIALIEARVTTLEAKETAATFDENTPLTYVDAIALAPSGYAQRFVTDALREGGGVGTLVYFDVGSSTWRRVSDNAAMSV